MGRGEERFRSDAFTFPATLGTGYCIVGQNRIRTNETTGGDSVTLR